MDEPLQVSVFTPDDGPGVFFDGGWAGLVRGAPGAESPWHHHGNSHAVGHVLSGVVRLESGSGGGQVVESAQGQYLYLPRFAVHREANRGSDDVIIFVVRFGPDHMVEVEAPGRRRPRAPATLQPSARGAPHPDPEHRHPIGREPAEPNRRQP